MKRISNLYEGIISLDNLRLADRNACKSKKWQNGVIAHLKNREKNILELHKVLVNREFKTSIYSNFTIFDKKEREIFSLPYFPDRILHHAILQIISPIFIKCFISQTYSCIPKRGIHKCLKDVNKALRDRENTIYCLSLDIRKFYPSINKSTIKDMLRRKFKDRDLLNLLDGIVDSHYKGLPIGSYTSQFFGNFYLSYFDHWIKENLRIKYYFRYMDNIFIFSSSKSHLRIILDQIVYYLNNVLTLELSNYQIFSTISRGIDFVGYKSYHSHILLRKSIKNNFIRMVKSSRNDKSIASYNGWLTHCNSINLKRKYL